ncbi:N-acylneuraminate cytidylyltransferase [Salinibacter ruber]|uniref:acylneuraminate cytidylyltransferase family protein n=1 Tax=Salinibacter ruber TaxID=146919 RepID=UPI002168D760|nr:acylneuraminate cytidylyltransferase family protein [Salinibacter ruber]MCS4044615.1 N-acylneuraminate cytidylyltransferase [Salinibacter ruber]
MIDESCVIGVILARGGSKGLPRKNIRDLAGKPLIAWTIEAGHASSLLDRLILSSDDEEIMAVAEEYGCEVPFQRPAELAQDETPSVDALLHALDQVESHDYIVMLQPTSPLRTSTDIDATITKCYEANAPACVTVTKTDKPPQWMYTLRDDHRMEPVLDQEEPVTRRQDAPDTYVLNGAVYVARTSWLLERKTFKTDKTLAHKMPKHSSVDIDDKLDLMLAEELINKNYRE